MVQRTLIKGGRIVPADPGLEGVRQADVLVVDGKIVDVRPGIEADDAQLIDASGTIVMPGFVDAHRHTWETAARGLLPDATLDGYLWAVNGRLAPEYGPEDIRIGTYFGALECLNAGITTVYDWSHCNNTPAHADAGIAGLTDAGIRAVYAYGPPSLEGWWGFSDKPHPEDARRAATEHFASKDALLTLALALRGPGMTTPEVTRSDWMLARDIGARISVHVGMRVTGMHTQAVEELDAAGLLGPDVNYVHANEQTDAELAMIAASGGSISIAPYAEMLMGHGHPPTSRASKAGVTVALGTDVATTVPGEMFTQMRVALSEARISEFGSDRDAAFAPTLTHHDVLNFATIDGARACGLESVTGSLTVGKDADIILITTDAINTMPAFDDAATIVMAADTSNVDTVMVRGEIKKRHGKLVGVHLDALRAEVISSQERVLRASGFVG